MTFRLVCFVSIALSCFGGLRADDMEISKPGGGQRVDEFFTRFASFGFHGTVLVATSDGIVLRKGYGLADRARNLPNRSDTTFGIASLDKQFTSMAILLLEERGKLSTSDSITKYFDLVPEDKHGITISHLLHHRSGLRNTYRDSHADIPFDQFLDKVLNTELAAPIGQRWIYSNSGFNILEHIVEVVSGQNYEAFLAENIFEPAGMTSTGQNLVQVADDRPAKYRVAQSQLTLKRLEPDRPDPFLSFRSTVDDLYQLHLALQTDQLLPRDVKTKLFQPVQGNYANGWYVGKTTRGTPLHYHGGHDSAVELFAMLYRYPAEDTVIIVLSNTTMNDTLSRAYLSPIVERLVFGEPVSLPPVAVSLRNDDLKRFEGTYQLENGAKLQVVRQNSTFLIRSKSKPAVTALVYPDFSATEALFEVDSRILNVFDGMNDGDFEPLKSVLWKAASFERAKEKWMKRWRYFQAMDGEFKSVREIHRLETEHAGNKETQSHLLLQFEEGARLVRAIRNQQDEYWFDEIRLPFKFETSAITVSDSELAAWNVRLQMGPTLQFDEEGKSLVIKGQSGRTKANRAQQD